MTTFRRYRLKTIGNRFSPSNSYFYHLSKEIYDYLFVDRNLQNLQRKRLREKIEEYSKLREEIKDLIRISDSEKIIGSLGLNEYEKNRFKERIISIPVEKNSSAIQEIVFVKNMIALNKYYFDRPRLSDIQDLMCMPIFKRQLDISTINRIHKRMQEQKNAVLAARQAMAKEQSE